MTSTHRNRMKKQKMFHQNWLSPPRKRERSCSRNLLGWHLSYLPQNRYSVLYSSWGTFRPVWKRSGALYEAWVENLGFHFRVQSQLNWISIEDLKCMRESELFLFRFQEIIEKQARCFYILPTTFLCSPYLANFARVWHFLVKYKWKPYEQCAKISVTAIKGPFTWRWGTPGGWGNPPVHIISYFILIKFTW